MILNQQCNINMDNSKKELREIYREKRKSLDKNEKNKKDLEISSRLLMTEEYRNSDLVLIYFSGEYEIDTRKIINMAFINKKRVAIPKVFEDKTMKFFEISDLSDVTPSKFGVMEPKSPEREIKDYKNSICITPCFCIDFTGHRVGYGGGYYDRFFKNYNLGYKIALSYTESVIREINYDDYDIPCDVIITDTYVRYIK